MALEARAAARRRAVRELAVRELGELAVRRAVEAPQRAFVARGREGARLAVAARDALREHLLQVERGHGARCQARSDHRRLVRSLRLPNAQRATSE